jgi:hypothetical protein
LAYQPPASRTFLSKQTSHQQPASSTFLSEQTISHQPTEQALSTENPSFRSDANDILVPVENKPQYRDKIKVHFSSSINKAKGKGSVLCWLYFFSSIDKG